MAFWACVVLWSRAKVAKVAEEEEEEEETARASERVHARPMGRWAAGEPLEKKERRKALPGSPDGPSAR